MSPLFDPFLSGSPVSNLKKEMAVHANQSQEICYGYLKRLDPHANKSNHS